MSKVNITESRYPLLVIKDVPTPKYARRSVKVLQDFNNVPESTHKIKRDNSTNSDHAVVTIDEPKLSTYQKNRP